MTAFKQIVSADRRGVGKQPAGFRPIRKSGRPRRRRAEKRCRQKQRDDARCPHPHDDRDLRRECLQPKPKRGQKRERGHDRFGNAAREDVVPHDFHAARHGGVDAIQGDDRHRAKHDGKRGHHFRIEAQPAAEKADERDRDDRKNGALHHAQQNGETKERAAPGAVAGRLGPGDEGDDRIVEAEDADLAHEIGRRPRDGENAERGRAEQPGHEEGENAPEVRGEQRDEVRPRSAFQFRSMIDWRASPKVPGRTDGAQHGLGGSHGTREAAGRLHRLPRGWLPTMTPSCIS